MICSSLLKGRRPSETGVQGPPLSRLPLFISYGPPSPTLLSVPKERYLCGFLISHTPPTIPCLLSHPSSQRRSLLSQISVSETVLEGPAEFHLSGMPVLLSFSPLCMACGILVPRPGIKFEPEAVKAWSPNHWTTREFPLFFF